MNDINNAVDKTPNSKAIASLIWHWLDEVIIGENFCPFAKSVRRKNEIRLYLTETQTVKDACDLIKLECLKLDENQDIDTTLVAFSRGFTDFNDYLFLIEEANNMLERNAYEGIYQLASFHPDYLFEGEAIDAVSHYTNRSPVPLVHIIREESISRVLKTFKDPESIPERNVMHSQKLGAAFFKQYLSALTVKR